MSVVGPLITLLRRDNRLGVIADGSQTAILYLVYVVGVGLSRKSKDRLKTEGTGQ